MTDVPVDLRNEKTVGALVPVVQLIEANEPVALACTSLETIDPMRLLRMTSLFPVTGLRVTSGNPLTNRWSVGSLLPAFGLRLVKDPTSGMRTLGMIDPIVHRVTHGVRISANHGWNAVLFEKQNARRSTMRSISAAR